MSVTNTSGGKVQGGQIVHVTEGQKERFGDVVLATVRKVLQDPKLGDLTKDRQRFQKLVLANGNIPPLTYNAILELLINQTRRESHSHEVVECSLGYPTTFRSKSPQTQAEILRELFPEELGDEKLNLEIIERNKLKEGFDWAVFPNYDRLSQKYHVAISMVLEKIAKQRSFANNLVLAEDTVKLSLRTAQFWAAIRRKQRGGLVLVPVQTGLKFRGMSPALSEDRLMSNEFGLGLLWASVYLLTHPERLEDYPDLGIDCIGSRTENLYGKTDHPWSMVPMFYMDRGILTLEAYPDTEPHKRFGSASGLILD